MKWEIECPACNTLWVGLLPDVDPCPECYVTYRDRVETYRIVRDCNAHTSCKLVVTEGDSHRWHAHPDELGRIE